MEQQQKQKVADGAARERVKKIRGKMGAVRRRWASAQLPQRVDVHDHQARHAAG